MRGMSLFNALRERLLLVAKNDRLITSSCSMASTQGRVGDDLCTSVLLLFKSSRRMHAVNRLGVAGAGARCGSRCRRRSHLHIVTVGSAQLRCMLMHLLAYPVLLLLLELVEVVDAVEEGWLLTVGLFRVRTIQVKSFGLLITDWIGSRIIERVVAC